MPVSSVSYCPLVLKLGILSAWWGVGGGKEGKSSLLPWDLVMVYRRFFSYFDMIRHNAFQFQWPLTSYISHYDIITHWGSTICMNSMNSVNLAVEEKFTMHLFFLQIWSSLAFDELQYMHSLYWIKNSLLFIMEFNGHVRSAKVKSETLQTWYL